MTDRPWKHIAKVSDSSPIAIDCDGIKEFPLEDPNKKKEYPIEKKEDPNKKKTIADEHGLNSHNVTDPTPIVIYRGGWQNSAALNARARVSECAMVASGRPNFMNIASQFNSTAHESLPIVSQADEETGLEPALSAEWPYYLPEEKSPRALAPGGGGGSGTPAREPIHLP